MQRFLKGSGIDGLSCIPTKRDIVPSRLSIVRPLLGFSKERIRKICIDASQEWIEDPSNLSSKYDRGRIRIILRDAMKEVQGNEHELMYSNIALAMAEIKDDFACLVCKLLHSTCKAKDLKSYGFTTLNYEKLMVLEPSKSMQMRVFRDLIYNIGGHNYALKRKKMRLLTSFLESAVSTSKAKISLGGCSLYANNGLIHITREFHKKLFDNSLAVCILNNQGLTHSILYDRRFFLHISYLQEQTYEYGASGSPKITYLRKNMIKNAINNLNKNKHAERQSINNLSKLMKTHNDLLRLMPVIVDNDNKIVCLPHIKYISPNAAQLYGMKNVRLDHNIRTESFRKLHDFLAKNVCIR